jgi:hypothetical protein
MADDPKGILMPEEKFRKLFIAAVEDENFRKELEKDPFGVLKKHGVKTEHIHPEVRDALARSIRKPTVGAKCGVCGVCGLCSLCGEIDLGSGSAAAWALFMLSLTAKATTQP